MALKGNFYERVTQEDTSPGIVGIIEMMEKDILVTIFITRPKRNQYIGN